MSYRTRRPGRRSVLRAALWAAVYGAAFLAVVLVAGALDRQQPEPQAVFGSLEGRFLSDIKQVHHGETVYYRENEITNYLIIGVDNEQLQTGSYQNGGQADFLLVLSIDRRHRTITPVMIDRDTMTRVNTFGVFGNPAGSRHMQICLAQAFSGTGITGSQNTKQAVTDLLGGVKIGRTLTLDMDAIALMNDALGGVTVTLEDDFTMFDPTMQKGATVTLHGDMAEYFVRGRMTVADGTNASRMKRQRTYIEAMLARIGRQMESNEGFMESVLGALDGHLAADVSTSSLLNDINAYDEYQWNPMQMLPGSHRVGDDGFTEFWPEKQAFEDMIVEIWFD